MSDEQKAQENEVFEQELSVDDLDAAAGGRLSPETAKRLRDTKLMHLCT